MFTPPRADALAPRLDEGPNAMPGMATAFTPRFSNAVPTARPAPRPGRAPTGPERAYLLQLQRLALRYFLENQRPCGLVLDRQRNHGPRRAHGLCSTAATGMGLISLALASAPPHRLLPRSAAVDRARAALKAALESLPHDRGVVPHFVHSASGAVHGNDAFSTVETAWLLAGALWSAAFLRDRELAALAGRLYERVDWRHWTAPDSPGRGLLRHGKDAHGHFLACAWDRLNGETAFMYVLAAGAPEGRALPAEGWQALRPFVGTVAGLSFNNADLGLFVFQYGLDLLDLDRWQAPGPVDLWAEAAVAVRANERSCRAAAERFTTYRRFWGLSAGDGPGEPPRPEVYRPYSPAGPIDGTAHLTAALASVAHGPDAVLHNLDEARHDRALEALGRYGFSNVNLDRRWVGRDMVGIDAGAAVLALDNYLHGGRVRAVFHDLPCVGAALQRLRFTRRPGKPEASGQLSKQS
jgi:hypothetical protein